MRAAMVLVFVFLCLTLQTTLLTVIMPFRPELAIPFVLYLGLRHGVRSGAVLSFLLGYLYDIFLGNPVGLHSFSLILIYLAVRPTHDKIRTPGFWPLFFLGLFGSLGMALVNTAWRRLLIDFPVSGEYLSSLALSALSTAFFSAPVVWVVQWLTGVSSGRDEDRLLLR